MIPPIYLKSFGWVAQAAAVLYFGHYSYAHAGYGLVAIGLVLLPPVVRWARAGRTAEQVWVQVPEIIVGLSAVVLVSLSGVAGKQVFSPAAQILIALGYAGFAVFMRYGRLGARQPLLAAAIPQALGLSALFLIATFWHWNEAIILVFCWALSFLAAFWYLRLLQERAALILATTWALVVTEVSWVFTIWLVNYTLLGGEIIVPQTTLVVLGLGYCFTGIYQSHNRKRLSRRRLIEYMIITGILLAIIVAGTRWSGTS